jgi:hypothetical protein
MIRVWEAGHPGGFDIPIVTVNRRMKMDAPDRLTMTYRAGLKKGPRGTSARGGELPAQAQVAAWARRLLRSRADFGRTELISVSGPSAAREKMGLRAKI